MIPKSELKRVAKARLADAELLLKANHFDGASYLSGYAIEIGLKLRICKTLRWKGFPETNSEFQGFGSFKTHDFDILLRLSGIENKVKTLYLAEWSDLKPWKPELRYAITGTASASSALKMVNAAKTILGIL